MPGPQAPVPRPLSGWTVPGDQLVPENTRAPQQPTWTAPVAVWV